MESDQAVSLQPSRAQGNLSFADPTERRHSHGETSASSKHSFEMTSPVEIQIMSDLHLEFQNDGTNNKQYRDSEIIPKAPILALLGDIGYVLDFKDEFNLVGENKLETPSKDSAEPEEEGLFGFLERQLWNFEYVLYVMGNHEPYGTTWPAAKETMRAFAARMEKKWTAQEVNPNQEQHTEKKRGRFIYLDGSITFDVPNSNVTILGCTLFSKILPSQEFVIGECIGDFTNIEQWTTELHNESFSRDLSRLNSQVARIPLDHQIMVLTHYSPCFGIKPAVHPEYLYSESQSAFASDLRGKDVWEDERVVVWAWGHTHFSCDFVLNREGDGKPIRLVAEQRGYQGPGMKVWSGSKVIQIV